MQSLTRSGFAAGFITASLLIFAVWAYFNLSPHGGHIEDSPSGQYTVLISTSMKPQAGGTYVVHLFEKPSNTELRTFSIALNSTETTIPLRGEQVSVQWDAAETFADISVRGEFLVRISVPSHASP